MPSPKLKLLIFDMGRVFINYDWDAMLEGFARRADCNLSQVKKFYDDFDQHNYELGLVSTEEFVQEINQRLCSDITLDEFHVLWNHSFAEDKQMVALLAKLKKQIPLCLLSNTNESHFNYLQSSFDVTRHFNDIVLSHQIGLAKPDQRIYQNILERNNVSGTDCFFVDDKAVNTEAAKSLNINVHQFTSIEPLRNELSLFGFDV